MDNDPDPASIFFDELCKVANEAGLIVTNWPGQGESVPDRAPAHIKEQMKAGLLPFIREATPTEVEDYGLKHGLFTADMVKYLKMCKLLMS